jgi:hypothetical protein
MTLCDPPDLEDVLRGNPIPPCENPMMGLARLRAIVLRWLFTNEHKPSILTVLYGVR